VNRQIERAVASITEDQRADYLWDTKAAARASRCHPNKFHAWWYRTRERLIDLAAAQPGETSAELAAIIALGIARRDRHEQADKRRS
jgi:hypothetical protein